MCGNSKYASCLFRTNFDIVSAITKSPIAPDHLPAIPAPDAAATSTHQAKQEQYLRDLKDFTKKDGIAQKFIVTSMEQQP